MRLKRPSKSIGIVFCIVLVGFGIFRLLMKPHKTAVNSGSHEPPAFLTTSLLIIGALGLVILTIQTIIKSTR